MEQYEANKNKKLDIVVDGEKYLRIPVKTHIITEKDNVNLLIDKYVKDIIQSNDIVFIAESIVAIMQKRAIKVDDVKPRRLALFLSKRVSVTSAGPGLSHPETMEIAMREVGAFRMIVAATASVFGKILGKKGWFYKVAGSQARDIDPPADISVPPFNEYIVLGPENPQLVADKTKEYLGNEVLIVDINDIGADILGNSTDSISDEFFSKALHDNPLGQNDEQTPIGILRKVTN